MSQRTVPMKYSQAVLIQRIFRGCYVRKHLWPKYKYERKSRDQWTIERVFVKLCRLQCQNEGMKKTDFDKFQDLGEKDICGCLVEELHWECNQYGRRFVFEAYSDRLRIGYFLNFCRDCAVFSNQILLSTCVGIFEKYATCSTDKSKRRDTMRCIERVNVETSDTSKSVKQRTFLFLSGFERAMFEIARMMGFSSVKDFLQYHVRSHIENMAATGITGATTRMGSALLSERIRTLFIRYEPILKPLYIYFCTNEMIRFSHQRLGWKDVATRGKEHGIDRSSYMQFLKEFDLFPVLLGVVEENELFLESAQGILGDYPCSKCIYYPISSFNGHRCRVCGLKNTLKRWRSVSALRQAFLKIVATTDNIADLKYYKSPHSLTFEATDLYVQQQGGTIAKLDISKNPGHVGEILRLYYSGSQKETKRIEQTSVLLTHLLEKYDEPVKFHKFETALRKVEVAYEAAEPMKLSLPQFMLSLVCCSRMILHPISRRKLSSYYEAEDSDELSSATGKLESLFKLMKSRFRQLFRINLIQAEEVSLVKDEGIPEVQKALDKILNKVFFKYAALDRPLTLDRVSFDTLHLFARESTCFKNLGWDVIQSVAMEAATFAGYVKADDDYPRSIVEGLGASILVPDMTADEDDPEVLGLTLEMFNLAVDRLFFNSACVRHGVDPRSDESWYTDASHSSMSISPEGRTKRRSLERLRLVYEVYQPEARQITSTASSFRNRRVFKQQGQDEDDQESIFANPRRSAKPARNVRITRRRSSNVVPEGDALENFNFKTKFKRAASRIIKGNQDKSLFGAILQSVRKDRQSKISLAETVEEHDENGSQSYGSRILSTIGNEDTRKPTRNSVIDAGISKETTINYREVPSETLDCFRKRSVAKKDIRLFPPPTERFTQTMTSPRAKQFFQRRTNFKISQADDDELSPEEDTDGEGDSDLEGYIENKPKFHENAADVDNESIAVPIRSRTQILKQKIAKQKMGIFEFGGSKDTEQRLRFFKEFDSFQAITDYAGQIETSKGAERHLRRFGCDRKRIVKLKEPSKTEKGSLAKSKIVKIKPNEKNVDLAQKESSSLINIWNAGGMTHLRSPRAPIKTSPATERQVASVVSHNMQLACRTIRQVQAERNEMESKFERLLQLIKLEDKSASTTKSFRRRKQTVMRQGFIPQLSLAMNPSDLNGSAESEEEDSEEAKNVSTLVEILRNQAEVDAIEETSPQPSKPSVEPVFESSVSTEKATTYHKSDLVHFMQLYSQGKATLSVHYLTQALEKAQRVLKDPKLEVAVLGTLAFAYQKSQQFDKCCSTLKEQLQACNNDIPSYQVVKCRILGELASIYFKQKRYQDAEYTNRDRLALATQVAIGSEEPAYVTRHEEMPVLDRPTTKNRSATTVASQAGIGPALAGIGNALRAQNKLEPALDIYGQHRKFALATCDKQQLVDSLSNEASILMKLSRYPDAIPLLSQEIDLYIKHETLQGDILHAFSKLAQCQKSLSRETDLRRTISQWIDAARLLCNIESEAAAVLYLVEIDLQAALDNYVDHDGIVRFLKTALLEEERSTAENKLAQLHSVCIAKDSSVPAPIRHKVCAVARYRDYVNLLSRCKDTKKWESASSTLQSMLASIGINSQLPSTE